MKGTSYCISLMCMEVKITLKSLENQQFFVEKFGKPHTVLCTNPGWGERLRNDLFCVELDILSQYWLVVTVGGRKEGRKSIYIALFWPRWYTQSAQAWITQFYLQITLCLPFFHKHSLDGTTRTTVVPDIKW